MEAILQVLAHGGDFSLENPEFSLMWATPHLATLRSQGRAFFVDLDQCAFGAPSVKPTRLAVSHELFTLLHGRCDGTHSHVRLQGKVWSDFFGKYVFRTKLAQVYPAPMCDLFASLVVNIWDASGAQFSPSFTLTAEKRKRPLGQPVRWAGHRQQLSALKAVASGYQLKRGALNRSLTLKQSREWRSPGLCPFRSRQSWWWTHPCALPLMRSQQVVRQRLRALQYWEQQAQLLLPETALRRLLRGAPDGIRLPWALAATSCSTTPCSRAPTRSTSSCRTYCCMDSRSSGLLLARSAGSRMRRTNRALRWLPCWRGPGSSDRRSSKEFNMCQPLKTCPRFGRPLWRMLKRGQLWGLFRPLVRSHVFWVVTTGSQHNVLKLFNRTKSVVATAPRPISSTP